jgi:Dolichyl-phosphate-mannose-protein mannosyltransferase
LRPSLPDSAAHPDARVALITRIALIAIVALTLAVVLIVRLRFAGAPLERDEGEYAFAGQLILEGVPPYDLVYNMKFPGTYYAYAAIMAVFGQTAWGIRVGLLCVHLATGGLLVLLGRRLVGTLGAVLAAAAFGILALDRWTLGIFAHATHFVLLPALASLVVVDVGVRSGKPCRLVAAGVLAGVAVAMKQHAIFLALLTIALAVWPVQAEAGAPGSRIRRGALVLAGILTAFALLVALLAASGVFDRFWFWTFQYAAAYVSEVPASSAFQELTASLGIVMRSTAPLWYAAIAGVIALFAMRWRRDTRWSLAAWLAAAALSIAPGFYFREHYFILLLPVLALFVAVAAVSLDRVLSGFIGATTARAAVLVVFATLAGLYVYGESAYLFRMSDAELVRSRYGINPFLESPEIGRYLKAHTTPADRIVVLGSEPQILFYAHRRSATGYVYMYGLMEAQPYASRMQDEMMREVEASRPTYIVFVSSATSWLAGPHSDTRLLSWANTFTSGCYDRVGIADVFPDLVPTIRWDADSTTYQQRSSSAVLTFRRRQVCTG